VVASSELIGSRRVTRPAPAGVPSFFDWSGGWSLEVEDLKKNDIVTQTVSGSSGVHMQRIRVVARRSFCYGQYPKV
jgi:hypothetical protein